MGLKRGIFQSVGFEITQKKVSIRRGHFSSHGRAVDLKIVEALLGGGGGLYVPRLNFKPFHVAISEGSHVAVGISSKSTDIDIAGNV